MGDIAIKAEHLSKYYKLGVINNGTLFRDIQSWWALRRGKDDPHSKIGSRKYDSNEDGFWALKDLNFEIKQGDRVGVIGKNGAGKSTLLKVLSRITAPTEGDVKIKGRVASLLEVGTGFHGELTGRENIYLNGAILGMKRREVDRKIDEIIAFSEIEKYIDTPVKRYSSGMYVRLAFAVAAHLDSEILIADEVLAVGDAAFQKKALGKMNELSTGQGRTVLFVSHQMNAVKNLCNKGIVLERGEIIYESNDVGRLISNYLSAPTMMLNCGANFSEFSNEIWALNDFYLIDKFGEKINRAVSNDEEISFVIDFEYKKYDIAFCVGYCVYDENNDVIYWSYFTDVEKTKWLKLKKGNNKIKCVMPKHFLNEGNYFLKPLASLHFIQWLILPDEAPCVCLNIKGGLSKSPYWHEPRPGICAPVLEWTFA